MKTPENRHKPWYQATIVLGNFEDELEAINVVTEFQNREDFVSSEIQSSFMPTVKDLEPR